ncbi:MAG: hypothetical protein HY791_06155 [Deltaproteobacteria bacterium]|nr:hypothetical protein [Deltaproteobacteria bacterium]
MAGWTRIVVGYPTDTYNKPEFLTCGTARGALLAMRSNRVFLSVCLLGCVGAFPVEAAAAEEAAVEEGATGIGAEVEVEGEEPATYANLRFGASSANSGRPEVCLELTPIWFLGIEGCGTGSGVWHHDADSEMSHYRLKVRGFDTEISSWWLDVSLGLGFAELQVSDDDAGFRFTDVGARGVETAGPDASLHLRARIPLSKSFELVSEMAAGAAYFPHAEELVTPRDPVQGYVSLGLGLGF